MFVLQWADKVGAYRDPEVSPSPPGAFPVPLQSCLDTKDVVFSLQDLRSAKGITQGQMAAYLGISKSLYHSIENGQRKPRIDVLYKLAALHQTSMEFVYHAFYRRHIIWHFPGHDLEYALRQAKSVDIQYLREREPPHAPPKLPDAVVLERNCRYE